MDEVHLIRLSLVLSPSVIAIRQRSPNCGMSQYPLDVYRWDYQIQQGPVQDDIEIGEEGGQGYLLLRWNGWMCDYHQHPYDVTQTSLRSLDDPLEDEAEHGDFIPLLPEHIPTLRRRQE